MDLICSWPADKRHLRSDNKKSNADKCPRSIGGGRWIRTTEVSDNRFTVCPIWPLWNSPIFNLELVDGFEPPTC